MNIAKYLWLLLLGLWMQSAFAQSYVFSNDIPVSANGQPLKAAWAGGLNAPQFSSIDLDNDGRLDLMVFDRVGPRLLTFLNGGLPNTIDYHFAPAYIDLFPAGLKDWVLLRDFDDDGFIDIFAAVPQVSNVRVFRNTSAMSGGTLSFQLFHDTLISVYPPTLPLYMGKSDIPAIDDIDGDGDLDILTFHIGGQKIEWHKNLSIENTGGLLGMDFMVQSRCFGHFEEDPFTCSAFLNLTPCASGERTEASDWEAAKTTLHSGSTTLSLDLNNDGLRDLIIGDVGCPTLYSLVNGGTTQIAHFSSSESHYPDNDSSVFVTNFPAPYYLDIDNDGIRDLVTAPNDIANVEDVKGVMFHKNVGANDLPQFQFQRYGILQEEMIDLGSAAMPAFWDYDDDGLQDLIVGGAGRYDSIVGFIPKLMLYANTGTAQQPAFTLVSDNYLGLGSHGAFAGASWIKPAPGDLDGDGDDDLLLGSAAGTLYYYVNSAAPGNPASLSLSTSNFSSIDVGINSAPQLVDLDNDSDLDLLIGNHRGYIHYYKNQGTPSLPSFVLVDDTFGRVKINDYTGQTFTNGYAQPLAIDYDDDSDLDLLVGGIDGYVQVFENISLVPGATFQRGPDLFGFDYGLYASMAATTLDSGRLSYVVGDYRGGLMLLRDNGPVSIGANHEAVPPKVSIFPNPTQGQVQFQILNGKPNALSQYSLIDAFGRVLRSGTFVGDGGMIDLGGLPPGIYAVIFSGKAGQVSQKIILTRG